MKLDRRVAAAASNCSMRKVCPNLEREDGLDTVLEVPIPEEMFAGCGRSKQFGTRCTNMMSWMRSQVDNRSAAGSSILGRDAELQLMLGVVGAPLVPIPMPQQHYNQYSIIPNCIKEDPIETSMAKYIVQQYIAAAGGEKALNGISSMYAMGKVRMAAMELRAGGSGKKPGKGGGGSSPGEMGGFVLWQKRPDLWSLELLVSGCKISAGSNGKIAWRQTPWHQSHASRGPPRPLRRSLQGLDPKSTGNLFTNAVCIGEKRMENDDCFLLRLDAEASTLRSRSSSSVEIIRHTLWGYFSQRTALLLHLQDTHLLRIKIPNQETVYWETTMETSIKDYRAVDGIQIAHAGKTTVSLFRFGEREEGNTRTRMEETWTLEEVDFNIWGLSMDCFLPPADIKDQDLTREQPVRLPMSAGNFKFGTSHIAALNIQETTA